MPSKQDFSRCNLEIIATTRCYEIIYNWAIKLSSEVYTRQSLTNKYRLVGEESDKRVSVMSSLDKSHNEKKSKFRKLTLLQRNSCKTEIIHVGNNHICMYLYLEQVPLSNVESFLWDYVPCIKIHPIVLCCYSFADCLYSICSAHPLSTRRIPSIPSRMRLFCARR